MNIFCILAEDGDTSISSESEREDDSFLRIKAAGEEASSSKTITY
jgi:hypothetical protein